MFRGGGKEEEVKHGCNEVAVACRLAWGEGVGDSGPVVETCRPGEVKGTRGPVGTYTRGRVVGVCEPAGEGTCRSGEVVGTFEPAGEVTCRQGEVVDICGLGKVVDICGLGMVVDICGLGMVVDICGLGKVVEGGTGGGAASRDDGGGAASRDGGGGAAPRDDGGARPFHVVVGSTGKPVEDVTVVGNCSWLPLD
ncbi:hypothetical protein Nepgr_024124 [Nepenthes gracilis]|uniref:Uncharacterized protein n=1 Tax=Nepenthes gracilis TaxID=150966 RepID=A0AAD3T5J8_NEPGR|nr:hypothetical protein Nepgr_024124 [Nepenthes gracilis]